MRLSGRLMHYPMPEIGSGEQDDELWLGVRAGNSERKYL